MIRTFNEYISESRLGRIMNNSFSDKIRKDEEYPGDLETVLHFPHKDIASIASSIIYHVYDYSTVKNRSKKYKPYREEDGGMWEKFTYEMNMESVADTDKDGEFDWGYQDAIEVWHTAEEMVEQEYKFLKEYMEEKGDNFDPTYFDLFNELINGGLTDFSVSDEELQKLNRPDKPGIYL